MPSESFNRELRLAARADDGTLKRDYKQPAAWTRDPLPQ
jgi:hypothetical protein